MALLTATTGARKDPEEGPAGAGQAVDEHANFLEVPVDGPIEILQGAAPEAEGLVVAAREVPAMEGLVRAFAEVPVGGALVQERQTEVEAPAAAEGSGEARGRSCLSSTRQAAP